MEWGIFSERSPLLNPERRQDISVLSSNLLATFSTALLSSCWNKRLETSSHNVRTRRDVDGQGVCPEPTLLFRTLF